MAKQEKQETAKIVEYLTSNPEIKDNVKDSSFTENGKHSGCFKNRLEEIFETSIPCEKYESVINGEGNEKDKINTVYSSSLQSLLVFSNVSRENPILIDKMKYTDVFFEYRNKVIGYPSSIDVVLTNKDERTILFIESKLYEIIRDSTVSGTAVVGVSYLSNHTNGYKNVLGLEFKDLEKLGIDYENQDNYGGRTEDIKKDSDGKDISIKPLKGNSYVYSYGVKQSLSHIIGILNWKSGKQGANCSSYLNHNDYDDVRFLLLYNDLPGFTDEDAENKQADFVKHQKKLFEILEGKDKVKIDSMSIKSYQEIYQENQAKNPGDFEKSFFDGKDMSRIVDFYRLNKS